MPRRVSIFDPPVDAIDPELDPYQVGTIQQYLQDNNIGLSMYDTGRNSAAKVRTKLYEQMLKDEEFKRMAGSRSYGNAEISNYGADYDKTNAFYDKETGEVVLFKPGALPHENVHANAPTGIDPYVAMQQYMKNTDTKSAEALRSAAFKWVKELLSNRELTSSVNQFIENGRPAAVEEMLAEIAGNRFMVPQGLFDALQIDAMEKAMQSRYQNKPFPGIMEYMR